MIESTKDNSMVNTNNLYFQEMRKYPLLSDEEEHYYLTMLNDYKEAKLLLNKNIDGIVSHNLNTSLLFNSLCNNSMYLDIINDLLMLFGEIECNSDIAVDLLLKYKKESNKVNRSLNKQELLDLFNIVDDNMLDNKELLQEIKNFINYKKAFNKLFVSNLRLVSSIVNKHQGNVDTLELINEGNLYLMRAINNFDLSLGNRFSTYATACITQGIRKYIMIERIPIKYPDRKVSDIFAINKKINKLIQQEKRTLSISELSELLSIPEELIAEYQNVVETPVQLDKNFLGEEKDPFIDTLKSDDDTENSAIKTNLIDDIKVLFKDLNPREALIMKMYFGMDEYRDEKYNTVEIAKMFKVSPQRIQQLIAKSLFRMRRYIKIHREARELQDYINIR